MNLMTILLLYKHMLVFKMCSTFRIELVLLLLLLLIAKRLLDLCTSHFPTRSSALLGPAFQSSILLIEKSLIFLFPLKEFQPLFLLVILQHQKKYLREKTHCSSVLKDLVILVTTCIKAHEIRSQPYTYCLYRAQ